MTRLVLPGMLVVSGAWFYWNVGRSLPEGHADIESHFKYGSIGSDNTVGGIPFALWKALPEMFPEYLPDSGKTGYAALGMLIEPGHDRPVGFSRRRVLGLDILGMNCALCHTSTLRESAERAPRIVLGMPANAFNLEAFYRFLFACAADGRLTAENVLKQIEKTEHVGPVKRVIYTEVVHRFRERVLEERDQLAHIDRIPPWGPGRIDTYGLYKALFFGLPVGEAVSTVDFPTIWNQRPREGMPLHWDGNNADLDERNLNAALGVTVAAASIDLGRLKRVTDWVRALPPPLYPVDRIDQALAERGKATYAQQCASCHDFGGARVGKVVPIDSIGTDRNRLDSFTPTLADSMNTLGAGQPWRFSHFKKTMGYVSMPLDGVWLRAPYLHNGSVPTLADLLATPDARPRQFYRGYDVYDWQRVGFVSTIAEERGRKFFEFDTRLRGNGNGGHLYGTALSAAEKRAVIEYLKTR
jgi:mono/diheme cytochrome c family protein